MSAMFFLTLLTESHESLYKDYFLKTLPKDCEVVVKKLEHRGDGSYYSTGWQQTLHDKLIFILDWMSSSKEDFFVVSDIDIQFFPGFSVSNLRGFIQRQGHDIAFQKESRNPASNEVNGGFYIIKRSANSERLFTEALMHCQESELKNDQISINHVLGQNPAWLKWGHLPLTYYARSQGFPPPDHIVMHHANWATTIDEKIAQFELIRNYVDGGVFCKMQAIYKEMGRYLKKGDILGLIKRKVGRII